MDDEYKVFTHMVGIVKKIQTLSGGDGEYRITIDVPVTSRQAIKDLMDQQGKLCAFAVAKKEDKKEEPT